MKRPLNIRQKRFAELVASGMPATRAYMEAGYSRDPRIAEANAFRLMGNDGVKAVIAKLRVPQTKAALSSRDHKRAMLREVFENPAVKMQDRLRAIELDARLAGQFEPDRTEIEVGERSLQSIRERAKEVCSALVRRYEASPVCPSSSEQKAHESTVVEATKRSCHTVPDERAAWQR